MNVERLKRILDAVWFDTLLEWEKANARTLNSNVKQAINTMKQTNDTGLLYDLLMLHRDLNLETIISFKPDGAPKPEEPLKVATAIMENKELIIEANPEELEKVLVESSEVTEVGEEDSEDEDSDSSKD